MSDVKTSSEKQFSHVLVTYLNPDLSSHLKRKLGCVLATCLCTYLSNPHLRKKTLSRVIYLLLGSNLLRISCGGVSRSPPTKTKDRMYILWIIKLQMPAGCLIGGIDVYPTHAASAPM